jgi:hypothetical protein
MCRAGIPHVPGPEKQIAEKNAQDHSRYDAEQLKMETAEYYRR